MGDANKAAAGEWLAYAEADRAIAIAKEFVEWARAISRSKTAASSSVD